jgi:hypothetical protein
MLHRPNCPNLPEVERQAMLADEPILGPNRGNAGKGRPKGAVNKSTKAIKDMVIEALNGVGGVDYLQSQARDNPTAFLTLVGKTLPLQVAGEMSHAVKVSGALQWKQPQ